MKTEGAIRHRLGQVIFRYRKRFVEQSSLPSPLNCKHNGEVRLPILPSQGGSSAIHVCRYHSQDGDWNNVVCDLMFGGLSTARSCPLFEALFSPEQLKQQFNEEVRKVMANAQGEDPKAQEVARMVLSRKFPDAAMLLWVLGSGEDLEDIQEEPPAPEEAKDVDNL